MHFIREALRRRIPGHSDAVGIAHTVEDEAEFESVPGAEAVDRALPGELVDEGRRRSAIRHLGHRRSQHRVSERLPEPVASAGIRERGPVGAHRGTRDSQGKMAEAGLPRRDLRERVRREPEPVLVGVGADEDRG